MKVSLGAKPLAQPCPVWMVGSYDAEGQPNVMCAAWGGIVSSKPVSIGVSVRPSRYTYANIMERKAFTISVANVSVAKEADYFGLVSGKNVDKFAATGMHAVKSDLVDAPYIEEFPLVIECKLSQVVEVGLHHQLIGEVIDIKIDEEFQTDGTPDIAALQPLIFGTGNRAYHGIGEYVGKPFDIGKVFVKD
ncbi:MAG: flavin reductase family protein [Desulfovibrio sp.]